MKYIKLFESFDSNVLTNIVKYVSTKIEKKNLDNFKNDLTNILLDIYNIKLSDIKDDNVEYISTKNAMMKINDKKTENELGVYFLKFWFSIEDGYLGVTGEGNKKIDEDEDENFNEQDIDYIKNNLGIKKGNLIKIKKDEIKGLENGDEIIFNTKEVLKNAKIYRNRSNIYAISDGLNGSEPNDNEWRVYGNGAWQIYDNGRILSDHNKLYKYIKNDLNLSIVENKNVNFYNNNYLLNRIGKLRDSDLDDVKDIINNSDFTMIVNINDILSQSSSDLINLRKNRREDKLSSNHFKTDKIIKRENFDKLMDNYLKKFEITDSTINTQSIKYIISNILCGNLIFFKLERNELDDMERYIKNLKSNKSNKSKLSGLIKRSKLKSIEFNKVYKNIIREYSNDPILLNFLNDFMIPTIEMGKKLNNYILSRDLKSMEDVEKLLIKIDLIRKKLITKSTIVNYSFNDMERLLNYKSSVKDHIKYFDDVHKKAFKSDLDNLKEIGNFISSFPE